MHSFQPVQGIVIVLLIPTGRGGDLIVSGNVELLLARIAVVVRGITTNTRALQTIVVDNLAAIPGSIIAGSVSENLSQLQARVVEQFVVDRCVRAKLLLLQRTGRNVTEAGGIGALRAVAEVSREGQILRVFVGQTTSTVIVVGNCTSGRIGLRGDTARPVVSA